MRRYRVHFWEEKGDECDNSSIEVEAKDIFLALYEAHQQLRVFKRIYKIEEV